MPNSQNLNYEFGPYRLNLALRRLTCEGERISLTPKAVEILALLVTNAGHLVEKDFLLKEVWPDTFVEESNLSQNIFLLRRALGDERDGPKYIETVTRRGYRFIASVRISNADESEEGSESETEGQGENGDAVKQRIVIAVLPFVNATGNPNIEYLSEGITDNIINNLSRVSRLRVMSRSAVFRRRKDVFDPLVVGRELGAKAVLVGQISARPVGMALSVELVEVVTGWQLWGETFDCELKDILEIQDTITRQLLVNLKLKLTGEEEKRITARYTENAEAYQAYLEGRYHWSRYTREGIEKAIGHFRQAIEQDANYALAYAAIVDCYLRLATNYLPPEEDIFKSAVEEFNGFETNATGKSEGRIKLRFKWDWKGVERELRRATDLRTNYLSIHQWYFAYRTAKHNYAEYLAEAQSLGGGNQLESDFKLTSQIPSIRLTPAEEVQILCSVARDQVAIGNYEAARLILRQWSTLGKWPKLDSLNGYAAADLLFTIGHLFGSIAGTNQVLHGHRYAEALLNGSVALFEQLGLKSRSVEARIELSRCYYRQGLLDIARGTILAAVSELPPDELELKTLALINLGVIERDSGRLKESLNRLREAASLELAESLVTGRCNIDLATTLKDLALSEHENNYLDEAKLHFLRALYESEALGHHRNVASVENNIGFLLINIGSYSEAEQRLLRARRIFAALNDIVRGAQVNDTLARLYIETAQHASAKKAIDMAVGALELTDSEAILAEALTTKGIVESRVGRYSDAKTSLEAAYKVAERCGDVQGSVRALLAMFEELPSHLDQPEMIKIATQLTKLRSTVQQPVLLTRIEQSIAQLSLETNNQRLPQSTTGFDVEE